MAWFSPVPSRASHFSSVVLVYSIYVHLLLTISPSEGLTYPRYVSNSFRFPNDHDHNEERVVDPLKAFMGNIDILSAKTSQDIGPSYGESRKSSIPISPSSGLLSSSDHEGMKLKNEMDSYEDAEIIESDGSSSVQGHNATHLDEEVLRKLLCSTTCKTTLGGKNGTKSSGNGSKTSSPQPSTDTLADLPSQLRYDLQAGKCSEVGTKAHCGENMIFVADIDSGAYGYCECDFDNKIQRRAEKKGTLPTGSTGSRMNIPLVYYPASKSCHRLYDQAYCNEKEWLVLSRELRGPACEPRKCPSFNSLQTSSSPSSSDNKPSINSGRRRASKLLTPSFWTDNSTSEVSFSIKKRSGSGLPLSADINTTENLWVPLNGTGPCVQLNKGHAEHCEDGEKVLFNVGDIVPKCGIPGRIIEGRAIVRNACPAGSFYSIIGRCQPDWDF